MNLSAKSKHAFLRLFRPVLPFRFGLLINPAFKQVTKCASEAQQNQSASVLNDEDHSREARPRRKIDLAKLQQADCHLFECRVNNQVCLAKGRNNKAKNPSKIHCLDFADRFMLKAIFLTLFSLASAFADITSYLTRIESKAEYKNDIKLVDFIYLINLDQRPEKLQNCLTQLVNYQISVHRFPAIYGWALTLETFNDLGLKFLPGMSFNNIGWPEHSDVCFFPGSGEKKRLDLSCYEKTCFHAVLSPGAAGCTLSHLSVLKDAYDSNYEIIWILEDDFLIQDDPHLLTDYIEKLDQLVGRAGWDVLYTDKKSGFVCFEDSHDCWRPDTPLFNQYSLLEMTDLNEHFVKIGARARTHSMLITRSGMKKILDFTLTHGIFNPYDADIAFVPGINLYCLKQDLITWSYSGSDTVDKNF